jgi:isopenicillin-N epimerase
MTSPSPSEHSRSISDVDGRPAVAAQFALAPDLVHLNHGSFGALPRAVAAEQERWRSHIERDATSFFTFELPGLMRQGAGCVAQRFGGRADDWVFCENATSAVNGVLAGLPLEPGDEIVTTSHAYGAVLKAMRAWAARRGAGVVVANLPIPLKSEDEVVEAVAAALGPRTRLLLVDHITSATAVILPVKRLVELAHESGIPVLVDGAHAPGQLAVDVPSIGADWYTGNAHKWLFAPRGCGLLWTHPARQPETLPAILSHGTDGGYTAAFDWVGTRDVTPWLCFEAGAQAHGAFGGAGLMERNRLLALAGAEILAQSLGAIASAPPHMRAAMAALSVGDASGDAQLAINLRQVLVRDYGVVVPVHAFAGKVWLRISAQIYNHRDDYHRCAEVFAAAAKDVGLQVS